MTLVLLILEMATKTKQIKIPNMSCQLYKLDLSINSGEWEQILQIAAQFLAA